MKRIFAALLAVLLLATMTACGTSSTPDTTATQAPTSEAPASTQEAAAASTPEAAATQEPAVSEVYSFTYEGVKLIPGNPFDASALPESSSIYEVPSCAIEGTDNVYNYNDLLEVTAFDDGTGEVIYSIYIMDANTPTAEGLYLGDTLDCVEDLYGTEYTQEGTQITYQKGDTQLILILENDCVISIEFRLAA